MALVSVEQQDLDNLDTALDEVTASLADKIAALVAAVEAGEPIPAGDLSALAADVENLRALSAPAPAG